MRSNPVKNQFLGNQFPLQYSSSVFDGKDGLDDGFWRIVFNYDANQEYTLRYYNFYI